MPSARCIRHSALCISSRSALATVRIYKIAELLGTTSQEVTALLKRDHGIDVKSASSTIEETQEVERTAHGPVPAVAAIAPVSETLAAVEARAGSRRAHVAPSPSK